MKICNHCQKVQNTSRWRLRVTLDQISEPKTILAGVLKELHLCQECVFNLKVTIDSFMGVL